MAAPKHCLFLLKTLWLVKKLTPLPTTIFLFLGTTFTFGQAGVDELFQETLLRPDYFLSYKKISIDWKMEGNLQLHFNNGLNNLFEGRLTQAVGDFDEVLKLNRNFWQALYYRGVCYKMMRELRAAQEDFHAIEKINPDYYETNLELAKSYILENNFVDAEEYLSRCNRIDSMRAEGPYLLGCSYFLKKDFDKAKEKYKLTLQRDSTFYPAQVRVGIIEAILNKDLEAAFPFFNAVLRKDSTNMEASLFRCIFTFKTDPTSSLKDINRVIRYSPTVPLFKYVRSLLYISLNDYDRAFSDLRVVMRDNQTDENMFNGKQTALDRKIDLQYAGFYVISKIYGLPDEEALLVRKAFCQLVIGQNQDCVKTLQLLSERDKSALGLYLTGLACEHGGDHVRALEYYLNALRYDNDILDAHKKLGIYFSNGKRLTESDKQFTEALRLNPELTVINNLRGVTRFSKGDYKGAIEDFTKCIAKDSMDVVALTNRRSSYQKLNDEPNANKDQQRLNAIRVFRTQRIQNTVNEIIQKRDTVSALKYLDMYSAVTKSTAAYIIKIKIRMKRQEWKQIYTDVNLAMDHLNPGFYFKDENSFLAYVLGLYYLWNGNDTAALTQFGLAIKIDDTNALAYLERGRLQYRLREKKLAKEDFKKAAELGSTEAKALVKSGG